MKLTAVACLALCTIAVLHGEYLGSRPYSATHVWPCNSPATRSSVARARGPLWATIRQGREVQILRARTGYSHMHV